MSDDASSGGIQPDPPETIFALDREPAPAPEPVPLAPVAHHDRIAVVDVLRGVAVFGIFLINMPLYVAPDAAFFNWERNPLWTGTADRLVTLFLYIFAQGKFYTLFSFLFGASFGIQLVRAAERHASDFLPRYARRLTVLLVIGLLHFSFIWWGDVLHIYAVLGFLLLLFRNAGDRVILLAALGLTALPFTGMVIGDTVQRLTSKPRAEDRKKLEERGQNLRKGLARSIEVKSNGAAREILQARLRRNTNRLGDEVGWSTELFAGFLTGFWAARRRILQEPQNHTGLLKPLARIALPIGLAVATVHLVYGYLHADQPSPLWRGYTAAINEFAARPAIAAGYAAVILLSGIQRWMHPFAAVGRMALTNYLLQSLVFTTAAYGYGLGLYGKIHPWQGLLLCVAFFALQLPFSILWLRHFRYGPAEWLWRSLTYGAKQPWTKEPA